MNYETIEAEALKLAQERGYTLNPWTLHSRELLRIWNALMDALTSKQINHKDFKAASFFGYRGCFESSLKVSKSAKVQALATEGLKLVERCEALDNSESALEARLKAKGYCVQPDITLWWLCHSDGKRITTFDAGSRWAALEIALSIT